ncbi:MAG: hypothetical protein Fur0025_47760 [Oscillatoriaceae cyanobacterium]
MKKLPEMGRAASGKYNSDSLAWVACSGQDDTVDGCLGLVMPCNSYHLSFVIGNISKDKGLLDRGQSYNFRCNSTTPKALGLGMEPQHKKLAFIPMLSLEAEQGAAGELEAS